MASTPFRGLRLNTALTKVSPTGRCSLTWQDFTRFGPQYHISFPRRSALKPLSESLPTASEKPAESSPNGPKKGTNRMPSDTNENNERKERFVLSRKQVLNIGNRLHEVTKRRGNCVEFLPGHDHKSVAIEFGVPTDSVRRLRQDLLGDLCGAKGVGSLDEVYARLILLEEKVTRLERATFPQPGFAEEGD